MRVPLLSIAAMSVLAGCAGQVFPSALDTALVPGQTNLAQTNLQNCHGFTAQVAVEGQTRQGVGQTCLQPDGSWRVTLNTPGLPEQTYTLPPQGIYPYPYPYPYPYADPSYWADPWFYGPQFVGTRVFLVRTFHHHHFKQGGYHHGGFHGGRK